MPGSDDLELVRRVQSGDLKSFEALYERYKGPIFRTALAITRQQDAAEEILQDCFLRAYTHIYKVDDRAPFIAWLHRIAVNLSYNWIAKRRPLLMSLEEVVDQLIAGPLTSPERAAEQGELQEIIQDALDRLPFAQRVVILLYYLQGFSLNDIAYILDCPAGTVKSRLHYGRENLRARLGSDLRLPAAVAYEFT